MPSNKVHQSCRFAALAALAVAAQTATVQAQQVSVTNPSVEAGALSVDVTGLNGSGFVVVHAAAEGGGPVVPQSIGNAYVPEGVEQVTVPIGAPVAAGDKLFVMLHTDSGVARVYEFGEGTTDIDTPVMVDGKPVAIPVAVDAVTARQAPALPGAQAIAAGDRVYTADQSSNTVTVISPAEEKVLGTITLGAQRIEKNMAPVDQHEENVHGLGFARDGSAVSVVSVSSNAVQVLDPVTNKVQTTAYVGRSPHEAFVSPDGKTVWAAIRGEGYVSVIDRETGEVQDRITTASGPSKVVFSPDGAHAFVNHLFANTVAVIDVASRKVMDEISVPEQAGGSADEAVTPDGKELWLGHPGTGHTTVIDARTLKVKAVLETGPRTNHPNFVTRDGTDYAYVTVGGLNQTKIFRRTDGEPEEIGKIEHSGVAPHGIWPSPDNSRLYVVLQKSDAVDIIDTATNEVIKTLSVGQDPQALIYVANAAPGAEGANLGEQGLGNRVENIAIEVRGAEGASASANIRHVAGVDEIDITARGLPAGQSFTVFGQNEGGSHPIRSIKAGDNGVVGEALAYADYFDTYTGLLLLPEGQKP